MLLLTSLLPSASSLAVPSVAQKQSSDSITIVGGGGGGVHVHDAIDQLARNTVPSSPFIPPAH
uniref:Uncharacterized protein n=2 Tax=Anopheles albimanus TaxID=7167 RepID=A0A182FY47_ANOAL